MSSLLLDLLLPLILRLLQTLLEGLLLQDPVVHEVEVETFPDKGLSKHRDYLLVVRALFEFQFSRIIEEVTEFSWVTMRQVFNRCNCLFDLDLLILLLLSFGWETLPWEPTTDEVHEDHAYLF